MSDLDPKGLEAAEAIIKLYGLNRVRTIDAIRAYEAHKASAVPDEVRALAEWLRHPYYHYQTDSSKARRAADLLEQMAREIEELKEALEGAVMRLRITQELAQQLADLKTPPTRNE